jgi:hypothetical protein
MMARGPGLALVRGRRVRNNAGEFSPDDRGKTILPCALKGYKSTSNQSTSNRQFAA